VSLTLQIYLYCWIYHIPQKTFSFVIDIYFISSHSQVVFTVTLHAAAPWVV